jgi:iron(II)-dependent oxidoreductase
MVAEIGREQTVLLARLAEAREATDRVFQLVDPKALYDRPIPERHRILFYIGHLEAFDRNLLIGEKRTEFDDLFAFGIDPVAGNLPTDQPEDWPGLAAVYSYRDAVRWEVDDALSRPAVRMQQAGSYWQLLNVAIEHRLMHAETLAYILHQLPHDRKVRSLQRRPAEDRPVRPETLVIPEGTTTLGLRRDSPEFGWDNEFEEQTLNVPAFSIDRYKVSNGEFLRFLDDGGYARQEFWSADDWAWLAAQGISHPVFWVRRGDEWRYRSMFDDIPLPLSWPVYVSHAEATAYCRWAGRRLPTEAEWQRAAYGTRGHGSNREPQVWDPAPVNQSPAGRSPFGLEGLFANGWEWTSSEFAPLPRFRTFPWYPGYSEPFFDGQHFVLKGGSTRTAACMLRPSFRNWFQSHYQYVYAGFRCAAGPAGREVE